MTVTFRCGHSATIPREGTLVPVCGACGERVVSSVTGATPRFTGACRGPYAETRAVDPDQRVLAATRLRLKEGG